jgi:hypothetical protein
MSFGQILTYLFLLIRLVSSLRLTHDKALSPQQFEDWLNHLYGDAAARRHSLIQTLN